MGVISIVRQALRPGTSLKHNNERIAPVDALFALARAPAIGSALIHSRQVDDNLPLLKEVVKHVAMEVFAQHEWKVRGHGRYSTQQTLAAFCSQTWREYLSTPCSKCKGHGFTGRKLDQVRHSLQECGTCGSRGYTLMKTGDDRRTHYVRKPCATCHGKRLVALKEEVKASRLHSCPACWGSGTTPPSVRARARSMHMDNKTVGKVWVQRFRAVLATLRSFENDALIMVREFLYADEA